MMKKHAIIPVRDFANTKVRLQKVLSESERAELTGAMLDIVLHAFELSNTDDVTVVATEPAEVQSKSSRFKKLKILREREWRGSVNRAYELGIDSISSSNSEPFLLLLVPSDLPFISAESVNRAIELSHSVDVVMNPSRKKDGTNLLLMKSNNIIPLHYDDNSYYRHLEEASEAKLKVLVVQEDSFSVDVDDEEDLRLLKSALGVSTFRNLIEKLKDSSK